MFRDKKQVICSLKRRSECVTQPERRQPHYGRKSSDLSETTIVAANFREEIERVCRVSDMLCSGHAFLRDKYETLALFLDLLILLSSTWLAGLAFVSPDTAKRLAPGNVEPMLWIGILGVVTFGLSIVQLKVDWKGRSDAHQRSFEIYAEVKRLAQHLLREDGAILRDRCHDILIRYELATQVGIHIPENTFLKVKKQHKLKVEVSKYLDTHPGASIWLTRLKILWRDNRN